MLKAEQNRAKIIQDLNRRIFEKFSNKYEEWETAINCLKILDVLCSLAEYARTYAEEICMPQVKDFEDNVSNVFFFFLIVLLPRN